MKKQIILLGLISISSIVSSQTWNGGTSTSDDAYRSGNVGIGLTGAPTEKLQVSGNIKIDNNGKILYGLNHSRTEMLDNANTATLSGFYETSNPSNYPVAGANWWHLLNIKHSNMTANNYAMQFAGTFFDQDLYFRKTNNTTTSWNKVIMANSAGKVGINNNTPLAYLHVKNVAVNTDTPVLIVESSSQGIYQNIRAQVNKVMKAENKGFVIENTMSNAGEVFKIYGEGRTLIGLAGSTEVPTAMLQIKSAIARESFRIYNNTETANYLSLWHAGPGGSAIDPIGSGKLYLGYDQQTDIYIGGNTAPGNNASRLGIGTSAISAYLHIKTPASAGSGHGLLIEHNDPNGNYASEIRIKNANTSAFVITNATSGLVETFKVYGDGRIATYFNNNTTKVFSINNTSSTPYESFQVFSDGRTYIGTQKPNPSGPHADAKLSVDGKVLAKSFYVTNAAGIWADYVFDKDYKLMTLKDLEKYINKNKHLPNVPSTKEVEINGIDLATTNAKLLEKIEEAYLHIIELNKRIELLEKINK